MTEMILKELEKAFGEEETAAIMEAFEQEAARKVRWDTLAAANLARLLWRLGIEDPTAMLAFLGLLAEGSIAEASRASGKKPQALYTALRRAAVKENEVEFFIISKKRIKGA